MPTALRVNFVQTRKAFMRKAVGKPNQRRPQSIVDERDLAVNEATGQHVGRRTHKARGRKDMARMRMRPPVSLHRCADDCIDERRNGSAARRFADDAALDDERERLFRRQDRLRRSCCHSTSP